MRLFPAIDSASAPPLRQSVLFPIARRMVGFVEAHFFASYMAYCLLMFGLRIAGQVDAAALLCVQAVAAPITCPGVAFHMVHSHGGALAIWGGLLGLYAGAFGIFARLGWKRWKYQTPAAPGRCTECWYDLTGNVSGVCPECGTAIQASGVVLRKSI